MANTIIENGTRYATIDSEGCVQRLDGMNKANDQWRIVGAVRLNNFGRVVCQYDLDDVLAGEIQWRHKNGKQRVHLLDFDHGTYRMRGSPNHSVI